MDLARLDFKGHAIECTSCPVGLLERRYGNGGTLGYQCFGHLVTDPILACIGLCRRGPQSLEIPGACPGKLQALLEGAARTIEGVAPIVFSFPTRRSCRPLSDWFY